MKIFEGINKCEGYTIFIDKMSQHLSDISVLIQNYRFNSGLIKKSPKDFQGKLTIQLQISLGRANIYIKPPQSPMSKMERWALQSELC